MPEIQISFTQNQIEQALYFLSLITFAGQKEIVLETIARHTEIEKKLRDGLETLQNAKVTESPKS